MAKIIVDGKEMDVEDGAEIKGACEILGIEFGCKNGFCRTCEATVLEGYENLTEMTENETMISLTEPRRLMCQCRIKHGTVKIKNE